MIKAFTPQRVSLIFRRFGCLHFLSGIKLYERNDKVLFDVAVALQQLSSFNVALMI